MSLFRRITKTYVVASGQADNWGGTIQFRIPREYWIESIRVMATVLFPNASLNGGAALAGTPSAGSALTADAWAVLVKRLKFEADEPSTGKRTIMDVGGGELLDWDRGMAGFQDRYTNTFAYGGNDPTSTGIRFLSIAYNMPFAHRIFPDPIRSRMCLPAPFYGSDPTLTLTLPAKTDIMPGTFVNLATPYPGIMVKVQVVYREINVAPDNPALKHIKTELVSNRFDWPGAGVQKAPLSGNGLVTSILMRHFQSNAATSGTSGRTDNILNSLLNNPLTDTWDLVWKSRAYRSETGDMCQAAQELSQAPVPGVSAWAYNPQGNTFFDLVSEDTLTDPSSLLSAMDLNPETLKGGQAYVQGNIRGSGLWSTFTVHRIIGQMGDVLDVNTVG